MGLPAARLGDKCIVHCSLPIVGQGSPNVFVNGIPAARLGDKIIPHLKPAGKTCVIHTTIIGQGSPKVFINGRPAAYLGSKLIACTVIAQGSPKVWVNRFNQKSFGVLSKY